MSNRVTETDLDGARIAIVIPGYNEAQRIGDVIRDVATLPDLLPTDTFEIIVVDDGSRDATFQQASAHKDSMPERARLQVVRHQTNLGKGAAAQTGCEAAMRLGSSVTVLMDGDGQHRAADVANLVKILKEQVDPTLIIGARSRTKDMPFMMRFGNGFLTSLSRVFFNIRVQDSQSGLRTFPTAIYPLIRWAASNYAMETEMLIMARTSGVNLVEAPIETIYFDNHKGTTPLDGLKIVQTLLAWRFFRSPGRHLAADFATVNDDTIQHTV